MNYLLTSAKNFKFFFQNAITEKEAGLGYILVESLMKLSRLDKSY